MRTRAAVAIASAVTVMATAVPALAGGVSTSSVRLTGEEQLPGYPNQGIARVRDGWILSGTNSLSRVDDALRELVGTAEAVPPELTVRGFNHVGDVDVVDDVIYAPLEQPDYDRREQAMARYDADTLTFRDARTVRQGHASFVTVDPRTKIAYSTDQFSDDTLLRYDVRRNWKRLGPLRMSRRIERIQGGDVAGGVLWLSTDDASNSLYRVDLRTGRVKELGNAGHVDGEGEGVDATQLPSGRLHMVTVDAANVPIWLGHLELAGARSAGRLQDARSLDSGWPPVLVGGAVLVAASAVGGVVVMMRRARAALRLPRR